MQPGTPRHTECAYYFAECGFNQPLGASPRFGAGTSYKPEASALRLMMTAKCADYDGAGLKIGP